MSRMSIGRRAMGLALAGLLAGAAAITAGAATGTAAADTSAQGGWRGVPAESVAAAESMATASSARRPAGQTLLLVTEEVRSAGVDVGRRGESPGDFFMFEERLYDRSGSRVVGRDSVRCEVRIRTFSCEGTILVNGRGKIHVAGALFGPRDNVVPVTGGTGHFSGVGGELSVFDLRGGRTLLAFHLIR